MSQKWYSIQDTVTMVDWQETLCGLSSTVIINAYERPEGSFYRVILAVLFFDYLPRTVYLSTSKQTL